ncbi:hypothetical protein ACHAWT_010920 [Skeletonema menzelii]
MRALIKSNLAILSQKIALLDILVGKHGASQASDAFQKICPIVGASIGQHYRHSMDHVELAALVASSAQDSSTQQQQIGDLHYDLRATSHISLVRVINISSLCASEPFPTMSLYCAGKAARDMFHAVLAKEQISQSHEEKEGTTTTTSNPTQFKVLNYAPGACNTAMTDVLAESTDLDNELQQYFSTSRDKHQLVRPDDTAAKLVGLLMKDEFESGTHVDYWDV